MGADFLGECIAVLSRTPAALDALLRGLPAVWTDATEGPGTWSPYVVMGHLIHCEKTDWMPRALIILEHGAARPFDPFDREAQLKEPQDRPLGDLLDEFAALRSSNLDQLRGLELQPAQLELMGTHPALGPVTLRQLLATWTAHDMAHVVQVSRVLARRLKPEVGPWAEYLSVMKQ
ncbi:MAG: DinB family protein [Paludibaculum sp.]